MQTSLRKNISPEERVFNAAKYAGSEVLRNEALLGEREATDSGANIQLDDGTTYEFNLDGQRKALTVRYHDSRSQVLEASTYIQDDDQDNIPNP